MHKRTAALFLSVCAWAAPGAAQEPAVPVYAEGRVLVMVPPEYPKEALARKESATVSVTGTILTTGRLDNIRLSANPPNAAFESAVRDVVLLWRLQPRIVSPGCGATEAPARLTVWFELVGGKPKVSFTPSRPPIGTIAPEIYRDRVPVLFLRPSYPPALASDPKTPKKLVQLVYVGVSADGAVTNVTVAPLLYYRDFEPRIVAASRQWRFASQARSWCGEVELRFGLSE